MSWRIFPAEKPRQFSDDVKAYAKELALAEALKQATDLQEVAPSFIEALGPKWGRYCIGIQRRLLGRHGTAEYLDDMLSLAWRANRFVHHYEAALLAKTLELCNIETTASERELATPQGCEKHYDCGILVAQHYSILIDSHEILNGTKLSRFPGTGEVLEALALDCVMHAALELPRSVERALELLADSVAANDLALQGTLHQDNFFKQKTERTENGRAGAQKRHAKTAELKAWTLEKYKEGSWKSANQAASELVSDVLVQSQKIGAHLTKSNAQRTIAEWIRKSS
ncbi:hypothetical protein [Herbaspirillum sp. SJZ099]|uniref:hypothetical protein n=1 Tax=Herbaspirillum sp. SJZ099 TaxID=2572916 RepID=UPI00119DE4A0|nr:hypothetical protein [Herbaspirillum sp. SJZ099]TWC67528.1 hypothetical protein FB597_104343 [Herbaspirillum sp. SJZ099]